ncbi:MAG TPA: DNA gyrase subunit A [Acidimicrobiaceae bacterium]|nr:DNA gyrase subunit A [Acidimicrobiaceae bacterium]
MSDTTNNDTPEESEGDDEDGAVRVHVEPIAIQTEMEQSFLDYAMSVIVSRALPDVRDGLKPVHRRIIWSMFDGGFRPDRSHVKCARVVGDVMGKYHPHGDSAIYDSLVRMGQTFSLRHPLIDPHGNFGSPNDPPAAMRYTECRLSSLAMRLIDGIDENTVDFSDNFDGTEEEPVVLPAKFPNLLVNGSQGIAVGMATSIPPHNLGEVCDATLHLIDNPEATVEDLMQFVKAPDFPTGGLILGARGIHDAYTTGRGSIRMRAVAEIDESKTGTPWIVVTEIPYQTSVEVIEEKAAAMVNNGKLEGIRKIRNESAKGKTRLVFELRRDAVPKVVLNNLFKYTPLQTTFSVNMVALDDGVPLTMNLLQVLQAYVAHQVEVITRRSQFRLDKAEARAHILQGLLRAIDMIDEIIALIRASENRGAAREALQATPFDFSEVQATHILDLPLGRLTRLGRIDLQTELDALAETIAELEEILRNPVRLREVISTELTEVRDGYANDRRTALTIDPGEFDIEDLIDDEELIFTLTDGGYVKTTPADEFRTQSRGGRGVRGAQLKEGDLVEVMLHTTAHAYMLFFTNLGRVFQLRAHEIPVQSRTARGTAIVNLLQLDPEETVMAVVDTRDYETMRYLLFATQEGVVKKTAFSAYGNIRQNGLRAIKMREDDQLVRVIPINGEIDVCLVTKNGRVMRFHPDEVREMGRVASGVRGVKLKEGDKVVSCAVARDDHQLLLVSSQGFGKRTPFDSFNTKHRGGQGVTGMKMRGGSGEIVRGLSVLPDDEAMLIAKSGVIIRMAVGDISVQGPHASGVRVMSVPDDDRVNAVTLVREPETDDDTDDTEAADGTADDTAAAAEAEPGDTAVVDSAAPVIEDDSELGDAE